MKYVILLCNGLHFLCFFFNLLLVSSRLKAKKKNQVKLKSIAINIIFIYNPLSHCSAKKTSSVAYIY